MKKQFQIIKPGTRFDFVGKRRKFAALSITLVALSVVALLVRMILTGNALNYGIDFRGGTQVQIDFQKAPGLTGAEIAKTLRSLGYKRVSVISVKGETNAYVIRMENPKVVGQARAAGGMQSARAVLKRRFSRTIFEVAFPKKATPKAKDVVAAVREAGLGGAREATPPLGAQRPTIRVMALSEATPKQTSKVKAVLAAKFPKATVSWENETILRRFKPSRSGEEIRLLFSEQVTEQEIRDAFAEAKVLLAPSAGAVARRGRQARHKIKWQVRLLGLSDTLTRQLNQKLAHFVKGTGERQNLRFALQVPPEDAELDKALRQAGFRADQPFTLRIQFQHPEKRAPAQVRSELLTAGLKLAPGSAVSRKGHPDNRRWVADLALAKAVPMADIKQKLSTLKAKLENISLRITEERYRAAVQAAGYGPADSIVLRVAFKLDQAVSAKQLLSTIREAKLPIAKHRETIAQVGRAEDHRWLVVLDVTGKDAIVPIEQTLMQKVGAQGITAIEIPPYGAVKSIQSVVRVGSKVGKKLRVDGILSVLYTLAFILLYIGLRFDLKFAPGAVIALAHDVTITTGIWAVSGLEFNLATIAALLTIVGYSLNDTIVVFDRIRENLSRLRDVPLAKVINTSVNETLSRTVLTSVTTLAAILPILFLAGGDLWAFALALTIGVVVGTYSSIYIASPFVIWLDGYLARRAEASRASAASSGGSSRGSGRPGRTYQKRESKKKKADKAKDREAKAGGEAEARS